MRAISERLTDEVSRRLPALVNNLQPALDLPNAQLEYLCPAMVGTGRNGILGGLVAAVQPGTWLIVLANRRKLFTVHFQPPVAPDMRRQILDDCVALTTDVLGHVPTTAEFYSTSSISRSSSMAAHRSRRRRR